MNGPAFRDVSALGAGRAVVACERPGRSQRARQPASSRSGLLLLALGAAVLSGTGPSAARASEPWSDAGAIVAPVGDPGTMRGFDSVLLESPGGLPSESVIADGEPVDDGFLATDGTVDCPPGAATMPDPVTFGEGLEMLCPGLGRGDCGPLWSVQVDALMLWRSNMQSVPLFLDPLGGVALDANEVQPAMSAGPRVGVIRRIGPCSAIEGNYFNVAPFAAERVSPPGGPFTMTNFGDLVFDDIGTARLGSDARIQSAELNWRRCVGPAIAWIAGFRWVQWNEQMAATYDFANPTPDDIGSGSVTAATGNDLYGGQIGVDAMLWDRGGPWKVSGLAKAGLFYNVAYQNSTAGFVPLTEPPYTLPMVSASYDGLAFVGEVGLTSTYWLTPWLGWRAGYSLFWLSGVAVAPQQFALADFGAGTTSINTDGSVLLQGVTTGLEARW